MKKIIPQMEPWFDEVEAKALYDYMKSGGWITEFKKTEELEDMICRYTGSQYCVMTNNGTISLIVAILALDLKQGDEILVPNLTMIATPNAAKILGLKPVLVDIEENFLCMDMEKAEKAITPRTKAVIYVPLNGRSGNMEKIVDFCRKHGLFLIEDAAQALGSFYKNEHLGTFGHVGSFSFSTQKIISTGQGGALVTNDSKIYQKIRKIKDFGRIKGGIDIHDEFGWNFKFTDLQAVIGIKQMEKLRKRVQLKKEIYKRYILRLSDIKEISFIDTDLSQTTPWFIDIYIERPDDLMHFLASKNIGSRRVYPPVSWQKIYKDDHKRESFPISLKFSSRGLWLPSSTKLNNKEIDFIVKMIHLYFNYV